MLFPRILSLHNEPDACFLNSDAPRPHQSCNSTPISGVSTSRLVSFLLKGYIDSMFPLSVSNLSLNDPRPNSSSMAESSAAAKRRMRRIPDEYRKRNAQSCDRCRKVCGYPFQYRCPWGCAALGDTAGILAAENLEKGLTNKLTGSSADASVCHPRPVQAVSPVESTMLCVPTRVLGRRASMGAWTILAIGWSLLASHPPRLQWSDKSLLQIPMPGSTCQGSLSEREFGDCCRHPAARPTIGLQDAEPGRTTSGES